MTKKNHTRPKQRIPLSQKTKEWGKDCAFYFRDACVDAIDQAEAIKLYRLANGDLDVSEYSFLTNPLNTDRPELQGYSARLKNYDIISPNLMSLMGDKKARTFSPIVIAQNSDFEQQKLKEYRKKLVAELQKRFINEAIKMGLNLEEEETLEELSDIEKKVKNIPHMLAKEGNDTLEYIMFEAELPRKFRKGFYDFIVTAMAFFYKDIINDKIEHEVIAAINCGYLCSEKHDFIHNGEAFRCRHYMPFNDVVDRFQDLSEFEEISNELEDRAATFERGTSSNGNRFFSSSDAVSQQQVLLNKLGFKTEERSETIPVDHVVWRGMVKEGTVEVFDAIGNVDYIKVDEDFRPKEAATWKWVDQIYEAYIIDDKHVVGFRPIPYLIGEDAKLPYNGRNFLGRHVIPQSIVKKGEPYQKTVNIIRYTMERTLSKNMDKLMIFPLGLLPNKEGWDEKTLMYYAQALSFLFVDETGKNFASAIQALKGIDMSLGKYVIEASNLIQLTKQEWDDVSGMSPQRKAQISASAGKGTTEAAIARSFVISEELFTEFEELEESEYNACLEISKYAYSDDKEGYYAKQDGTVGFFQIKNFDIFSNTKFRVFCKNGAKEQAKLDELRNNAQAFAQNQARPSLVGKIIGSENYQELLQYMETLEDELLEQQERQAQLERESNEKVQAMISKDKQDELDFKYYEVDANNANDIEVALIKDTQTIVTQELNAASENPDTNEGFDIDRMQKVQENLIKMMEIRSKRQSEDKDRKLKEKEIQSKEKIETLKAKTALKNKVSGEK